MSQPADQEAGGPDANQLVQQVVGEVQQVVPQNMPNTEGLVLANAIANNAEDGPDVASQAANPPRRPGLLSRIGSKVSGFFSGAKSMGLRLAHKLEDEVRGLWEALSPSTLPKKRAANVTKLIGGTVAPVGVAVGCFFSNVGVRISQLLEPAKDVVGAAGHMLNPVGLAFTVLSFILSVRSAFSSHKIVMTGGHHRGCH
jgi:hypothetical protein